LRARIDGRVRDCLCGKSANSVAKLRSLKKREKKGLTTQEVRVIRQRGKDRQDNSSVDKVADHQNATNDVSQLNFASADDEVAQGEVKLSPSSAEGLKMEQQKDPDVSFIIKFKENDDAEPPWEAVALASHDVKTLWAQWPRLAIKDGLLKRRFEEANGLSSYCQVIIPTSLRNEFVSFAHGGMTGEHLGRRRTSAAIQSCAYWPSWRTDMERFLRQCVPCTRYHRDVIPRQAGLQPTLVSEPLERVSVDITGPHPQSARQNQIVL